MIVVQINYSCSWGSTGKICDSVSKMLSSKNVENYIFYIYGDNPEQKKNYIKYGNFVYTKFQALKSKVFGTYGFNSNKSTSWLIQQLDYICPDIVHIHNIHGHDCNFELLFKYLKDKKIKVLYTFHDCWAFTGYCPHFTMARCDHWLSGCGNCILRKRYSWFFDKSNNNFLKKKEALRNLDLTIITPSQWLADIVKQSFLNNYPVEVINNGIDLDVFQPRESNFREKHGIENKRVILGVSLVWQKQKGIDVFIELAKRLPEEYKIILAGTDGKVDKMLPDNILSIHRTQNQQELAEIYTAADVFVNPTREENYPTVNMESIACGTPVITFNTGGSPEILDDSCGSVIECDSIDELEKEIIRVCTDKPYSVNRCIKKATSFNKEDRFKEYLKLYERVNIARVKRN